MNGNRRFAAVGGKQAIGHGNDLRKGRALAAHHGGAERARQCPGPGPVRALREVRINQALGLTEYCSEQVSWSLPDDRDRASPALFQAPPGRRCGVPAALPDARRWPAAPRRARSTRPPPASIAQPKTQADFQEAAAYWGKKYAADPKNREADLNYASALRRTGRTDQAVAVLQKAAIYFPDDREVLAEYGKALAAAGSYDQALDAIRRAETPDKPNWQLISAEAAILDQMGRPRRGARALCAGAEICARTSRRCSPTTA